MDLVETPAPSTVQKAYCSACGGERNCEIRGKFAQSGGDENYDWNKDWFILQCRGCEHVFAITISTNSEDQYFDYDRNGQEISSWAEHVEYWPAKAKRDRPNWLGEMVLGDKDIQPLRLVLDELYGALDGDLNGLAGIGIRTTFDIASALLGADPLLSFEAKLAALVQNHHIGLPDQSHLERLIEAGNASAHRAWRPSTTDLKTLMDVLESFLVGAFVEPDRRRKRDLEVQSLDYPAKELRKKKPAVTGGE